MALSLIVSLLVQLGLIVAGMKVRVGDKWRGIIVGSLLIVLVMWAIFVNDTGFFYSIFPLKYGFLVFNAVPFVFAAMIGLMVYGKRQVKFFKLSLFLLLLLGINNFYYGSAVRLPFACGDDWADGCCLQTTEFTCVPAAAATLLLKNGVKTTEGDMAKLCLTNTRGSSFWTLYYAMREKLGRDDGTVVFSAMSFDACMQLNSPAIVSVKLTDAVHARDHRYKDEWGWLLNTPHAVVFLGKADGGKVAIADPKIGVELWDEQGLRELWNHKVISIH
jgi:hypothetical protein